jgi:Fic family protein
MDVALFGPNSTGRLVVTIQGASAFVPNPLPPAIDREALFDAFGVAMAGMGMLNAKIAQLQNPKLIIRPLQKREALASSAMEGTYTTSDELALLDAGAEDAVRPETIEVRNYARALAQTTKALETLPISHRMIRNAHATLLDGLPSKSGGNKHPGEYKKNQNWIGGVTIQTARFVPPPPAEAQTAMDELERFINRENPNGIPALIEAAAVHYQFETIHPFADGNGRVGRILIPIILFARNAMTTPVFYPSATMEHKKDEYIDRMFAVSSEGDWTGWIRFFLEICAETCHSSVDVIDRILLLQGEYKRQAMSESRSSNPLILIDELFASPVISTPIAKNKLSVTHRAARQTIALLERLGIVEKMQGFNMPEYFIAREILKISA